jgi:predicted Rdx family selenoprotein
VGPGQLDVLVDGTLVFSRKTVGRMPEPGEVQGLVRALARPRSAPPP